MPDTISPLCLPGSTGERCAWHPPMADHFHYDDEPEDDERTQMPRSSKRYVELDRKLSGIGLPGPLW